jgi:hypothetical protein
MLGLVGNEVDEAMVTDCAQNDGIEAPKRIKGRRWLVKSRVVREVPGFE